ncbi:hypothetical protein [Paenibacillus agaridevorans]|uniref:hypothetical protein n=1 Tax=Paenibacillus agaridevorans TaxID=171404 RepID=UPI001BE4488B|nr:hypothetical protein [Paenibacillus agaridevorans]
MEDSDGIDLKLADWLFFMIEGGFIDLKHSKTENLFGDKTFMTLPTYLMLRSSFALQSWRLLISERPRQMFSQLARERVALPPDQWIR